RVATRVTMAIALISTGFGPRETRAEVEGPVDSSSAVRALLRVPELGPSHALFTRRDAFYAATVVGALLITAPLDRRLSSGPDGSGAGGGGLASLARPLGNGAFVLPVLAAGWGLSRAAGRPDLAGAFGRVAVSAGVASASAFVLKEAVGRPRPFQSPHD